jgi:hypothetical protein
MLLINWMDTHKQKIPLNIFTMEYVMYLKSKESINTHPS